MKQQATKDTMIQQTVDLALKMPVKASQQRLAAICVDKKGKVLGRGVNSYTRTHPLQKHFAIVAALPEEKVFLHAELQAVLRSRDKEIHTIDNLALLSRDDNSSLNNSIFPAKRDKIKDLDKKGSFIPICTKNVFLKYYSKDVKEALKWNIEDRKFYLDEIKETLKEYLGEING